MQSDELRKGTQALDRGFALFAAIIRDDGLTPAATLASALGFAPSSARRTLHALEETGLVTRIARGRYAGSERLSALASRIDPHRRLIEAARTPLRKLATATRATTHLGIFDGDMVTYLVKEGSASVFTRERGQLEAYCTGIGKALLAQVSRDKLETYLRGEFVRLTAQTLTEPDALRAEIDVTRDRGFAIDDREMADNIACVAMPVKLSDRVIAAISISGPPGLVRLSQAPQLAAKLSRCAEAITARLA
ncbi:IclR family transcriptional regulator [Phenylobacterium sp.]|uniref:IclR family transcriptional regulator n=1 Tax=Phenylobacterium sp. TaxID=1871053 RepID=UPI0035AD87BB